MIISQINKQKKKLPDSPKIEDHNDNQNFSSNSNCHIIFMKSAINNVFGKIPQSLHLIIREQLINMFHIHQSSNQIDHEKFIQILALTLHKIYHQKLNQNYHKFLVTQQVLALNYHSKTFLLHVFKSYDEWVYCKDNGQLSIQNSNSSENSKHPWSEAFKMSELSEIVGYQQRMYELYREQFSQFFVLLR